MSERWTPEINERFWYITPNLNACYTTNNDVYIDRRKINTGNCFKTEAEAQAAAEKVKALLLSLHCEPVTNCNQLPKLTAEVFDRPDCPEWAKWAAVDSNGAGYYYSEKPFILSDAFGWGIVCSGTNQSELIWGKFNNSGWKNSLIERPAKLPDWCKVGAWVYHDSDGYYYTVKSVDIENDNIQISDEESEYTYTANEIKTFFSQARLRPYNADEMRGLVGKVIKTPKDIAMVLGYSGERNKVCVATTDNYFTAETLLAVGAKLNGKPCGKLEHLDNGEWVE